jgi:hypothetical protein
MNCIITNNDYYYIDVLDINVEYNLGIVVGNIRLRFLSDEDSYKFINYYKNDINNYKFCINYHYNLYSGCFVNEIDYEQTFNIRFDFFSKTTESNLNSLKQFIRDKKINKLIDESEV